MRVLVVVFVVVSLIMLAAWLVAGDLLAACTLSSPLGWTVPVTIALVAAAVWRLLAARARTPDRTRQVEPTEVVCGSCGRSVFSDWRLCPYCAAVLDEDPMRAEPAAHES